MADWDKAIADYSEALRWDPKYVEAYNNRGVLYCDRTQDFERAIADFTRRRSELDPKRSLLRYGNQESAQGHKGYLDTATRRTSLRPSARSEVRLTISSAPPSWCSERGPQTGRRRLTESALTLLRAILDMLNRLALALATAPTLVPRSRPRAVDLMSKAVQTPPQGRGMSAILWRSPISYRRLRAATIDALQEARSSPRPQCRRLALPGHGPFGSSDTKRTPAPGMTRRSRGPRRTNPRTMNSGAPRSRGGDGIVGGPRGGSCIE